MSTGISLSCDVVMVTPYKNLDVARNDRELRMYFKNLRFHFLRQRAAFKNARNVFITGGNIEEIHINQIMHNLTV
jgi:hypothetical protein